MRVIGDIHGDFRAYSSILQDADDSVQVGDFGLGFGKPYPDGIGPRHRFIRGNHDDRKVCREIPNWISDGHVEAGTLGDRMFIGGAWSIDWSHRTPGVDWWDDEELNQREWEELMLVYEKIKPAVMITHDLPHYVREQTLFIDPKFGFHVSRTNFYLSQMFKFHQPKMWFHGHHHTSYMKRIEGCQFVGLGINSYIDVEI
jgi:hypothetical protein